MAVITFFALFRDSDPNLTLSLRQEIQENERLRMFNVRRERRLHWMKEPEKINTEAVEVASHVEGTPPSLVAALLYTENGPPDLETGSIDKTDYFAKEFPLSQWSALDGARTLNRMAWEYLLQDPKGRQALKGLLAYAAKPYTNLSPAEQKDWARNMQVAETRFRKMISEGKPYVPEAVLMRTPTPTISK
jgi:hypothetical protein